MSTPYQAPAGRDWVGPPGYAFGAPLGALAVSSASGAAVYTVTTVTSGASYPCSAAGTTFSVAGSDIAVLAYSVTDGSLLWEQHLPPAGDASVAQGAAIAASRDGSHVFVTGFAGAPCHRTHEVTVALDPVTGAVQWTAVVPASEMTGSVASTIDAGADGHVYVAGTAYLGTSPTSGTGYVRALDAASGAETWPAAETGPVSTSASAMSLDPQAGRLLVAYQDHALVGSPLPRDEHDGTDLVAYDVRTGALAWSVHDGLDGEGGITDVVVSPDGGRAYTLTCDGRVDPPLTSAALTRAYAVQDGAKVWESDYSGPGDIACPSNAGNLLVEAGGTHLLQAVVQPAPSPGVEDTVAGDVGAVATRALDASTGAQIWQTVYQQAPADASVLAASADGTEVFMAAQYGACTECAPPPQFVTIAYDASGGAQRWQAVYGNADSNARAVVAPPGSNRVVVLGDEDQCGPLDQAGAPQGQAVVAVGYDLTAGAASLPGVGGFPSSAAANCTSETFPAVAVPESPAVPAVALSAAPALVLLRRQRRHRG